MVFSRYPDLPPMEELRLEGLAIDMQERDEHRCVAFCDHGHGHADHHEGVGSPKGMPGRDPVDELPADQIGSLEWEPVGGLEKRIDELF